MAELVQIALWLNVDIITKQVHRADKEQVFIKIQLNLKQKGRKNYLDQPHEWWEIQQIEKGVREVVEEGELTCWDQ